MGADSVTSMCARSGHLASPGDARFDAASGPEKPGSGAVARAGE